MGIDLLKLRRALLALAVSAPVLGPAAPASADTVSYQVDAAHTGYVDAQLKPPLGRKWIRRDLGGGLTYPLIAAGKVFIVSAESDTLYALDPATGATAWSRPSGGTGIAFGHGRLFVTDAAGLTAVDPANGATIWTVPVGDASGVVVAGETVVVRGSYDLSGHRWEDGLELWQTAIYSEGGPASDGERLYLTSACGEARAIHARLGVELWYHRGTCEGSGGGVPRVAGGRVYVPESNPVATWQVLDTFDGDLVSSLPSSFSGPAIAGGHAYIAYETDLRSVNLDAGTLDWKFSASGEDEFAGPPLVVGGVVYTQLGDDVIAVARETGSRLWRGERSIVPTETYGPLAAGENRLLVPTTNRLVAFGPGADAPGVDDPDKTPASSYGLVFRAPARRVLYGRSTQLSIELDRVYSRRVELQASRYPYRRWRTIRRPIVGDYPEYVRVRPTINTRYRVIDRTTLPTKKSRVRQIYLEIYGRATYYARGPHAVRVVSRFRAPPALRFHKRRIYVYRSRSRRLIGRRVGSIPIRRLGPGRYDAIGVVPTPRLRRNDLFSFCIPNLPRRGYGRYGLYDPTCGRKRR